MALTYSTDKVGVVAGLHKHIAVGNYANAGGSTGGTLYTGLAVVEQIYLQENVAAVGSAHTCSSTLPHADGVTIVTGANEGGWFLAIGAE
jgi:hypothetical protein